MMKISNDFLKNMWVIPLTLSLASVGSFAGQSSTAFAETPSIGAQAAPIIIPEPPQSGDPVPDLDYYIIYTFVASSTPRILDSINAEGITDVQFTMFPFAGQNKEVVIFSLEAQTDKGWVPVFVTPFQPYSKIQKKHLKLPKNDYKNFRIIVNSKNDNFSVMGYKQWTS